MATVEMKGVNKAYGAVEVIENLNLLIDDGAFTVFVGPSGCGKSTLLRMIAGLEPITGGEVQISGQRVNDKDPIERGVAMVFQNYALYPHMTVEQNIGFSLKMAKVKNSEISQRVLSAARTLQIEELLDRKPSQLSGGQRQRVAIGRAIVRNPEVFLFDEPLSNLDAELRVSMRVEIAKLHNTLGSTMIYVTHDQTEAMTLADKIVVMRGGEIEQAGSPEELYDNPDNLFVAGFIGSPRMNLVDADAYAGNISLPGGTQITMPGANGTVKVGVRPEHLHPGEGRDGKLDLNVDVVENLGGVHYVYGTLSSGETVIVEDREKRGAKPGETVTVSFNTSDARIFSEDGKRLRQSH